MHLHASCHRFAMVHIKRLKNSYHQNTSNHQTLRRGEYIYITYRKSAVNFHSIGYRMSFPPPSCTPLLWVEGICFFAEHG